MAKTFSGRHIVKLLIRIYGFTLASQRGSHVKLKKVAVNHTIITIVPLHKELSPGTLRGVLDLAEIDVHDFIKEIR